jgi:hypothetical protein
MNHLKKYAMKRANYVIIASLLLALVGTISFLKEITGNSTSIRISESKNEFSISADFPETKSRFVHDYLAKKLNLSDLSDLSCVEIRHYQTPDKLMNFYINSRAAYVKIVLNKGENSRYGYNKMKETGEGLKKMLEQQ